MKTVELTNHELANINGGISINYSSIWKLLRKLGICDPVYGCHGGPPQNS